MLRLRLGFYGLAILAAAVLIGGVRGHSQTIVTWNPANITAVDRGVSSMIPGVTARSARRRGLRVHDRIGRSGLAYVPGRVIVKFRDNVSAQARVSALSQVSRTATMGTRQASAPFDTVTIDPADDAEAIAAALAARNDVEYAQPAYRVSTYQATTFIPNDPGYSKFQWNFPAIDLERGWAIQHGGTSSVIVAVVDTGVAYTSGFLTHHAYSSCYIPSLDLIDVPPCANGEVALPDLGTLTMPVALASDLATSASRFVSPYDFIWNTALPIDLDGHGTHVSSTIGELTNNGTGFAGIAFNVTLMPVKVIDSNWDDIFLSPNVGEDATVALGIRYAADHGAKVINMSIGRTGPANCGTVPSQDGCAPAIESAMRYAVSKGCFIAVAAGNDGTTLPANQVEVMAEIASRIDGAVSVAALDRQNNRASYSTVGSYVELSAPGGDGSDYIVQQTYDFTFTDTFNPAIAPVYGAPRFDILGGIGYEGTSMATPHVSGVAALLISQGITNPAAIEAALERFATDRGTTGRDSQFGFGEINARNTLRGLGLAN